MIAKDSDKIDTEHGTLRAGLYIVATPIGNLGDISRRAINTLKQADIIACEDTRVTGKLLNAMLIKNRMLPYHEHNGSQQRPRLLAAISEGKAVALVSDAGTPLISDPGYKLVAEAADAGHMVTTIPGASALTAALTLSGMATDRVLFMGFAPNKSGARTTWFENEATTNATLVFYESAKRLTDSLSDAAKALGPRKVAVCREITKRYEEVLRGDLATLSNTLKDQPPLKGEIVVVVEGASTAKNQDEQQLEPLLKAALKHMSVKDAAAFVAELTGERKKPLYQKALELSSDR